MINSFKYSHKKIYGFAVLCFLFFSFEINAQQLILKNFLLKDGLPSAEVYCAFQDSKGFIWFGSDGGVSKFDGYSFKNYTTEDGLADNIVFGIIEDKHGRIWFRSLSGKLCYAENDSIHKIGANELISQNMKNAIMMSIYVDSGDTMWCGLRASTGFIKISPGYGAENFQNIKIGAGSYAMEIENGHFISGSGLGILVKKNFSFISLYKKQYLQQKFDVPNLDATHVFYCKTAGDTFLVADKEKLFSIQQNNIYFLLDKPDIYKAETILLKKAGNYFWLGLLGKGVLRCGYNEKLSWKKNTQILDGFSVSDVLVDKEGGTWFTTLENGVYYSSPARFVSYQNNNERSSDKNYVIEKIGNDHIVVSNKLDVVDIVSSDEIIKNISISDIRLTQLLENSDIPSTLIITGSYSKLDSFMAYLWIKEKHLLKKIKYAQNNRCLVNFFTADTVTKINYFIDRYRMVTLDPSSDYVKELAPLPARAFSFYRDKKGLIWLGCLNGLWSFEKNKFTYHGNENIFLKSTIEDIKEDAEGTRYYATRGNGIIIYKDGGYSKITIANGLNSNNCKCIYIDENKIVWVGSKNGICRLTKNDDGWQVLKFNLTDNEFSYEVSRIEKIKNTLWLFTNKGLLSYELINNEAEIPPLMYVTQFSVNEISHLKDSVRVFNHDENFVRISYVGLSYQSLGKLFYEYKLEGLDTAWHTTQSTSIQYPFLPAGHYNFYIKAVSFNGTKSKYGTIHFTINKPFWQTVWFIASVLFFIIISIYLFFYYRFKIIRKKEEEKTLFNKQLAELEMKSLRSQMNPHFIFNAINSIQNYIVKNDSRTAQDYLAKFARLIRNVLENSKQENISLTVEIETLKLYIELEQLRAPDKFSFDLIVQPGLELSTVVIQPLILQPYVENAILHGLTPLTNRKGRLTIQLEKTENKLICTINDNGVGRKKAGELKQKKQLLHQSIGLSVTEARIKARNDLHKSESSITIEDKTDENGEAEGTRIIIVINLYK